MEPYTFDLQRIFFGDVPLLFFVEIVFRTLIIFCYTLLILRFFSGRGTGVGELSLFEFVLIILLGSAVGDPMFYPNVPILHGLSVITLVVLLQRCIIYLTNRYRKIEKVLEGTPTCLVMDGKINAPGMRSARLSFAEVQMELRQNGIENLAQVRRAFLETDGVTSVFKAEKAAFGLDILPDAYHHTDYRLLGSTIVHDEVLACKYCGLVQEFKSQQVIPHCPHCGEDVWVAARLTKIGNSND